MAIHNRRHNILSAQTVTASSNSGTLPNLGRSGNPVIIAILDVSGTVSGTNPTLDCALVGWLDSERPYTIANFEQVTATLTEPQRLVIPNVLEDNLELVWTVGGTNTPSFASVNLDILMTSPDA
jgi:hypothetical protein